MRDVNDDECNVQGKEEGRRMHVCRKEESIPSDVTNECIYISIHYLDSSVLGYRCLFSLSSPIVDHRVGILVSYCLFNIFLQLIILG